MNTLSLRLKILFGVEIIAGARVLLFTIPVIISKKTSGVAFPYSVDDWFVLVLSYASALYCIVGIAAICGHKLGKIFHYLAAIVVLFLNAFLLKFIAGRGGEAALIHYTPLIFAMFVTVCVALSKDMKSLTAWKSILVVDDDETLLKTIRPILMKEGYSVLTAATGETGYNVAINQKPDLIILDVILPGIKGRELCQKIKTTPETKDIPVIFLTAKFSEDDVKAELEAGASAHLTKPIEQKVLFSTIKKFLK